MTANNPSAPLPPPSLHEQRKGMVQLHLSVFLAGFTGLFGKLITLNEVDIVWYRMMLATMILLGFKGLTKLGLHWGMCSTGRSREEKQTPSPNLSLREREISSEGRVDGDSNRGAELPSTGFSWKKKVVSKRENQIMPSPHGEKTSEGERIGLRKILQVAGCGTLLGIHWILFYASIKASNVSIGVVCFSLVGFFTALFEPIINRHRFSGREFLFSLLTILGIYLIFQFDARYRLGIALGVISSALYALFAIANQRVGKHYEAKNMLLWEMIGGLIGLTCLIPLYNMFIPVGRLYPVGMDYPYLAFMVVVCTIGLCLLQIIVLQKIPAFTVNLTYNLEPVYSIILSMFIFSEYKELNFSFCIGIALIIISVVLQTWSEVRKHKVKA